MVVCWTKKFFWPEITVFHFSYRYTIIYCLIFLLFIYHRFIYFSTIIHRCFSKTTGRAWIFTLCLKCIKLFQQWKVTVRNLFFCSEIIPFNYEGNSTFPEHCLINSCYLVFKQSLFGKSLNFLILSSVV